MYDPPVYGEKGVPNSANVPGGRYLASGHYDHMKQEFWLFGGSDLSTDNGTVCYSQFNLVKCPDSEIAHLNDLWRYRVTDSTWTWMAGSNTITLPNKLPKTIHL